RVEAVVRADREGARTACDVEAGIADMGIAQCVADAVDDRIEALALRCRDIDLKQQVGTAAQIEAERHLLAHETRQIGELRRRQQVQPAEQHAQQAHPADQQNLPIREIQHACNVPKRPAASHLIAQALSTSRRAPSFSLATSRAAAGSGLAKTLAIVLRNTLTRTPGAMSISISSGLTTFETVPRMPPPATARSPRRRASSIAR